MCFFIIIYIIINYDNVIKGEIYNTHYVKSILITGIIILIIYILIIYDDDINDDNDMNKILIKKYKLSDNKINNSDDNYKNINKIVNNNLHNNIDNLKNHNIFISHKNTGKYKLIF